jgi:uncharacterized lipoprotein YmbA
MRSATTFFAHVSVFRGWSATSLARLLKAVGAQSCCALRKERSKSAPLHDCWWFAFGFAVLLLAGCSILPTPKADAARFYTLGEKSAAPAPSAPAASALRLGLARVELPAYLQNRAMAVRSDSEVRYEQNHRWAEPLDEAVARVVRATLLASPKVAAVFPSPFPIETPRDYDVTVRVSRCEGASGGSASAQFAAVVEITRADAGRAVVLRKTVNTPLTTWDGKNFAALAVALGQSAAALGEEIAAALPVQQ